MSDQVQLADKPEGTAGKDCSGRGQSTEKNLKRWSTERCDKDFSNKEILGFVQKIQYTTLAREKYA